METLAAVVVAIVVLVFLVAAVLAFKIRGSTDELVSGASPAREDAREVTQIGLGGSIIEAQVIEQRLKAQGYTVSLLKHEHPETGSFSALGNTALLVLRDEEQAVREELEGLGY